MTLSPAVDEAKEFEFAVPASAISVPSAIARAAAEAAPKAPPAGDSDAGEGRPAGGWSAMYTAEGQEEYAAAADPATLAADEPLVKQEEGSVTPGGTSTAPPASSPLGGGGGELPVDAEGNLPFFFIDAYENTEGRPGGTMAESGASTSLERSTFHIAFCSN